MKLKFKKGEKVELADFMSLLPAWLLTSNMLSKKGKPLVKATQAKKWLVKADIGIEEEDFNKTITTYSKRVEEGAKKSKKHDKKAWDKRTGELVIKNLVTYSVAREIRKIAKKQDKRIMARWVPSSSDNPSEEHMLNYGKVFNVANGLHGELPQERPNCQCSMIMLTDLESKE